MKKGLRLGVDGVNDAAFLVRTLALMKKGLRPGDADGSGERQVRTLALMKKGLRLQLPRLFAQNFCSDSCPDEEGIKTRSGRRRPLGNPPFGLLP